MGFWSWIFGGGGSKPKPKPPVVVPPPARPVMVVDVRGADGQPIQGSVISGELQSGDSPIVPALPISFYELQFELPKDVWFGSLVNLTVHVSGKPDIVKVVQAAARVAVTVKPTEVFLSPLERRGQFYYRDGQPFPVVESSDFRLYERFLNGENIEPVLTDRQGMGFNTLRVWLLNTSVGHIVPAEHPDFYARLRPFLGLCGRFGLYVEFTVFTQTQTLMPALAQQQAHYDQTVAGIGAVFCFVEGVNEADSHDNAVDPSLNLHKPAGATFDLCSGSNGADAWVVDPVRDSARYHSNDANEWQRRAAHNAMEMADRFGVPAWPNENTRPDHDPNPDHHEDAAGASVLLQAGYCHHDTAGKDSVVRAGIDRICAEAAIRGIRGVDLSQRTAPYVHRQDLEGPAVIRAYQRGSCIRLVRV